MKEYNWRDERRKYQNLRNDEAAPQNQGQQSQAPQDQQNQQNQQYAQQFAAPRPSSALPKVIGLAVVAVAVVAIAAILLVMVNKQKNVVDIKVAASGEKDKITLPGPKPGEERPIVVVDAATALAKQAEIHKHAVGVVALSIELQNGQKQFKPIGTAWAFAADKFGTNAHVAMALRTSAQAYRKKFGNEIRKIEGIILINGASSENYAISHVQVHRNYGRVDSEMSPDVAVLTIYGNHKSYFRIASMEKLYSLKAGIPVASLGYPMEALHGNNINLDNPIASMQTGNIVAVTDSYFKESRPQDNQFVRHNLPSAGGASGSAIFDADGEIVAVHWGGNYNHNVVHLQNDPKTQKKVMRTSRVSSAALINFAARADVLRGVGPKVSFDQFSR